MPLIMIYYFLVYNSLKTLKGDFGFAPTGGQKAKFIIVGIVGLLIISATLFLIVFL